MTCSFVRDRLKAQRRLTFGTSRLQKNYWAQTYKHILFLHVLGCDTTTRIHEIGKGASLKKFKESAIFREQAEVFFADSASTSNVAEAWEKAIVTLYNGKSRDTLDTLRYRRFWGKVASSSS